MRGSGDFQLRTSHSVDGPWNLTRFAIGGCNNPTAAFHPNRSLFVLCHDSVFSLHRLDPDGTQPAWRAARTAAPAIPTLVSRGPGADPRSNPGNCEDPFIFFDRSGRFHVLAHCYTHDQYYPGEAGVFCSAHGFSETGEAATWTWVGGRDAPYDWTSPLQAGGTRTFSSKERPWALLGGPGRPVDEFRLLINGVSPIGYGRGTAMFSLSCGQRKLKKSAAFLRPRGRREGLDVHAGEPGWQRLSCLALAVLIACVICDGLPRYWQHEIAQSL